MASGGPTCKTACLRDTEGLSMRRSLPSVRPMVTEPAAGSGWTATASPAKMASSRRASRAAGPLGAEGIRLTGDNIHPPRARLARTVRAAPIGLHGRRWIAWPSVVLALVAAYAGAPEVYP